MLVLQNQHRELRRKLYEYICAQNSGRSFLLPFESSDAVLHMVTATAKVV